MAVMVNSIGLGLDIIGVVILFCYALPPENVSKTGGTTIAFGGGPDKDDDGDHRNSPELIIEIPHPGCVGESSSGLLSVAVCGPVLGRRGAGSCLL